MTIGYYCDSTFLLANALTGMRPWPPSGSMYKNYVFIFQVVVLDEAHALKNAATARFSTMLQLKVRNLLVKRFSVSVQFSDMSFFLVHLDVP